jgi:conserved repeat domain
MFIPSNMAFAQESYPVGTAIKISGNDKDIPTSYTNGYIMYKIPGLTTGDYTNGQIKMHMAFHNDGTVDWKLLNPNNYYIKYVFVKASNGGYLFEYKNPDANITEDFKLHGLENNTGYHDISHVTIYYGKKGEDPGPEYKTIKVIKFFDHGTPSREGIEFTLTQIECGGNGITAKGSTDENGVVYFRVLPGIYKLHEVTTFEDYTNCIDIIVAVLPIQIPDELKGCLQCIGDEIVIPVVNMKIFRPDLEVTKTDGGITANIGDMVKYTINVKNSGEGVSCNTKVYETLPKYSSFVECSDNEGWNLGEDGKYVYCIGELKVGENRTLYFTVKAGNPYVDGKDRIINTVEVKDGENEKNKENNTATDDTPVNKPVVEEKVPDLKITKTDGGVIANIGDEVKYKITIANIGNAASLNTRVYETLPDYSSFAADKNQGWTLENGKYVYNLGEVKSGESKEIYFTLKVENPYPHGKDKIVNVVKVAGSENEKDLSNNTASDDTPVNEPTPGGTPDLPKTGGAFGFEFAGGSLGALLTAAGILLKRRKRQ